MMGIPAAVANQALGAAAPRECLVWPENWPAVCLFLSVQTQWRSGPNGLIGLDYGAVLSVARLNRTPQLRETMADLQVIETTILEHINRKGKR